MKCFFHLISENERITDEIGAQAENVEQAMGQIDEVIAELAADEPELVERWHGWAVEIVDSTGMVLAVKQIA